MPTIAEIINKWERESIPIEGDPRYVFEKQCIFKENPENPMECTITMVMRDKYTYWNGMPFGSSHVGVVLTEQQNGERVLKAIENEQFRLWLEQFTESSVNSRRSELGRLREAGQRIEFRP